MPHAPLAFVGRRHAVQVRLHRALAQLGVVGVQLQAVEPFVEALHLGLQRHAEDLARAARAEHAVVHIVEVPHAVVRAEHREREALLAQPQRLLGALALRDVDADAGHAHGAALGVAERLRTRQDPARRTAVGQQDAELPVDARGGARHHVFVHLDQAGPVVRVHPHAAEVLGALGHRRVGRQAEELMQVVGHEQRVGRGLPHPVAARQAGHGQRVTLLRHAARVFGTTPRIDVGDRAGHAQRRAGRAAHAQTAHAHPAPVAVVPQAVFTLVHRRAAAHVRLHRGVAQRHVVGVQVQGREPLVPRLRVGPRGQAEDLARACRRVDAIAGDIPIPDAFVGTGGGEREAFARQLQRRARLVQAQELAPEHRQQQRRQHAERERTRDGAGRLLAPGAHRHGDVARDDHRQRMLRHQRDGAEALHAVDRTHRAHRPARIGLAQRQHRIDHLEALAHRGLELRMARHQRAVAVEQRDRGAGVGLDVVVELLEVLDAPAGDDRAGEPAVRRLQPARDRQHPLLGMQHAAPQAGHHQLGAAVLEHRVQRIVRRVGGRRRQRRRQRAGDQLAGGVEQQQPFGLHQADRLVLQVDVQITLLLHRQRAGAALRGHMAQHQVHRLDGARRLFGQHARVRVQLARRLRRGGVVGADDVVRRQRTDGDDEQAAHPRHAAPRQARIGSLRLGRLGGDRLHLDRQHATHGSCDRLARRGLGQHAIDAEVARHGTAAFDAREEVR